MSLSLTTKYTKFITNEQKGRYIHFAGLDLQFADFHKDFFKNCHILSESLSLIMISRFVNIISFQDNILKINR